MRSIVKTLAITILLAAYSAPARADLVNSLVSGTMMVPIPSVNFFEPIHGDVPAGFGNSSPNGPTNVPISNTVVEFGFNDGNSTIMADFTGASLTLTDSTINGSVPINFTFTDTAFTGLVFTKLTDTFPGGVTSNLSGDTISLSFGDLAVGASGSVQFSLAPAIPEPSPFVMTAFLGTLGGAGFLWRRTRRAA